MLTLQIQESAAEENEGESLVKIVFLYELNEAAVNFEKNQQRLPFVHKNFVKSN